jgi:hypothetical protein
VTTRLCFPDLCRHWQPQTRLLEAAGGVPFYDYALDRSGHERAVEGVRSRMEKAAFEEAWDEGRAMGRGRAMAYALRRDA